MPPAAAHLRLPAAPLCLAEHPSLPLLAVGLSAAGVVVANVAQLAPHTPDPHPVTHALSASCTAAHFLHAPPTQHPTAPTGATAAAAAEARLLAASGSTVALFDAPRPNPVHAYALPPHDDAPRAASALLPLSPHAAVVGDDAGGLHLLDARAPRLSAATLDQGDYIAALASDRRIPALHAILAASGDGTLCAYDLRMPHQHRHHRHHRQPGPSAAPLATLKLAHVSDAFNDDLLSLAVCPDAPRAVAGCLSGALNVYDLNALDPAADPAAAERAARVDRFHGHPECVNAVLPTPAPGVVATASTDGLVRVVDVNARALLGVLDYDRSTVDEPAVAHATRERRGKRKKVDDEWPIEAMVCVNGVDKLTYALMSHDERIRFCDASLLCEDDGDDDDDERKEADGKADERVAEKDGEGARVEAFQPQALVTKSQRKKKKKQKGNVQQSVKEKRASDFFDEL